MYAGNLKTMRFTISRDGEPMVLDGFTAKWALSQISKRSGEYSKTPILEKKSTTSTEILKTVPQSGILEVYLKNVDTKDLLGEYYYELELYDTENESIVVAVGDLRILKNVDNT